MRAILKTSLTTTLVAVLFSAILFSFSNNEKNDNAKKYGGSASVTVQVDFSKIISNDTRFILSQQGVKNGDRRVIEVTESCFNSTKADAQSSLKIKIESEMKYYEKLVSSILYDISDCDN